MTTTFDLDFELLMRLRVSAPALLSAIERVHPDGIVVMELPSGQVLEASPSFLKLVEYEREELMGKRLSDVGITAEKETDKMLSALLARGSAVGYQLPIRRRSGGIVAVDVVATVINGSGTDEFLIFVVRNAQLAEDQQRYSLLDQQASKILANSSVGDPWKTARELLELIGYVMGWDVGQLWHGGTSGELRLDWFWSRAGLDLADFERSSRAIVFHPGKGILGSAWQARRAVWVEDASRISTPEARRQIVLRHKMRSWVCLPIPSEHDSPGALEFFSTRAILPDEGFLSVLRRAVARLGAVLQQRELISQSLSQAEQARTEYRRARHDYQDLMRHRINNPLAIVRGAAATLLHQDQMERPEAHELLRAIVDAADRLESISTEASAADDVEATLRPLPDGDAAST